MTSSHRVRINGEAFWARRDEVLLDAALRNGVDIPHDCRSGQCGKCRVRTVKGELFSGGEAASGEVHACQSRVIGDVAVAAETVPERLATAGRVAEIRDVSPDVVEVLVVPSEPMTILPGQYLNVAFDCFPARAFCPSLCLQDPGRAEAIHFHIRRVAGGRVTKALGREIAAGHRVRLIGPFGAAHLQPGLASRLVLAAEDTGFAPIWSIAAVALQEQPGRRIDLVVASTEQCFYMEPALRWLAAYPNVNITRVGPASVEQAAGQGTLADHLPDLDSKDRVYVAGSPTAVNGVMAHAAAAGALCLAEAFGPTDHLSERRPASLLGAWAARRRAWSTGRQPGSASRSSPGREPGIRSRRGLDFYLRGVAAAGAIVACSGLLLGALLPADTDDASASPEPAAAHAAAQQPGVPDLPVQVAVQLERDRYWAEHRPPSDGAAGPAEPARDLVVAGVWAPDASACSAGHNRKRLIPAVITADGASAGDTFCAFKRKKPTDTGMDVVATCDNGNRRWNARVRLSVNGNRLIWASERGTQAYVRCEPNLRMAEAR
jgi:NAD(P)H-flavin reductase/ferredoxin